MSWNFHNTLVSLLQLFLAVVSFFLGLRFVFRLLNANPSTPFVSWVYDVSGTIISPFRGIFVNPVVQGAPGGSVFDIVALVSFIFYMLLVYFLIALVDAVTRPVTQHEH